VSNSSRTALREGCGASLTRIAAPREEEEEEKRRKKRGTGREEDFLADGPDPSPSLP